LLLGFSQSQNGWDRPATIALLVIGFLIIVSGVWFDSWTTRSPVIPPRLFQTRTTGLIFATVFFHSFAFFCAAYYLPLYFQILGASATKSGVLIIPFSLLSSISSGLGGYAVSRMGDYRPIMWFGFTVMAIGYGLMIMLDDRSSIAVQIVFPTIAGFGLGFLFLPPLIGIQAAMPVKDMAASSTTFGLFRSLGSTIGISVGQAVWAGVLRDRLAKISNLTPSLNFSSAGLADSVRQIQAIQPDSARHEVQHAFTKSVSAIWIVNTPIICLCLFAVLFLKKYSLKRKVIRAGKKGAVASEVSANEVPPLDLEKGPCPNLEEGPGTGTDGEEKGSTESAVLAN